MESTFIRGFVLLLAIVGFGASSTTSHAKGATKMDGPPVCPPSSGQFCGMQ